MTGGFATLFILYNFDIKMYYAIYITLLLYTNKIKIKFIDFACTTVVLVSKSNISLLYYFVSRKSLSYIPRPHRSITESLPSCFWGITVIYHAGGVCCVSYINIVDEGSFIEWIFCVRRGCVSVNHRIFGYYLWGTVEIRKLHNTFTLYITRCMPVIHTMRW